MDIALIKLSLERLLGKVESLEKQNRKLKKRIKLLEENSSDSSISEPDVLIDTKEALQLLGVCYNTLRSLIKKKLIPEPIQINQRRKKFFRLDILNYIESLREQGTASTT